MTDDNSNLVDNDLDTFSAEFYGSEPVEQEPAPKDETESEEEVNETDDDTVATEVDEDAPQEEEPEKDDEEEEEEAPRKPKKQSAKARIEELYAANKRMERELAALKASAPKQEEKTPETTDKVETPAKPQPSPDDVNEDGEPKYKLGEFDPLYIKDLTHYFNEQDREAFKAEQAKTQQQQKISAEQEALKAHWTEKVEEAEQELPDLREKLEELTDVFADVEPAYGEFLAASIMSSEVGPQVMYYLSQNIGEAQKIVASGPHAALMALGRLEAMVSKPKTETQHKKPSKAPEPPEKRTRGSSSQFDVPDDTNDLAAFERKFYNKK